MSSVILPAEEYNCHPFKNTDGYVDAELAAKWLLEAQNGMHSDCISTQEPTDPNTGDVYIVKRTIPNMRGKAPRTQWKRISTTSVTRQGIKIDVEVFIIPNQEGFAMFTKRVFRIRKASVDYTNSRLTLVAFDGSDPAQKIPKCETPAPKERKRPRKLNGIDSGSIGKHHAMPTQKFFGQDLTTEVRSESTLNSKKTTFMKTALDLLSQQRDFPHNLLDATVPDARLSSQVVRGVGNSKRQKLILRKQRNHYKDHISQKSVHGNTNQRNNTSRSPLMQQKLGLEECLKTRHLVDVKQNIPFTTNHRSLRKMSVLTSPEDLSGTKPTVTVKRSASGLKITAVRFD